VSEDPGPQPVDNGQDGQAEPSPDVDVNVNNGDPIEEPEDDV
jgi:hypothetical protein